MKTNSMFRGAKSRRSGRLSGVPRRFIMKKLISGAALAGGAALAVSTAAPAMKSAGFDTKQSPVAAKQRVAITIRPPVLTWVLTPLSEGATKRDSGTVSWKRESEGVVMRDGQRIERWVGIGTFVGDRGRIVIRFRIDWLDAGQGHDAGTGTWRVIRGTRDYATVTGGGRSAHVWLPRGPAAARAEGYLRLP